MVQRAAVEPSIGAGMRRVRRNVVISTRKPITPRPAANLVRPPLLGMLDPPVVAADHAEQISHGSLTFKDRMALPPISARLVGGAWAQGVVPDPQGRCCPDRVGMAGTGR